ncbi:isocitrate lyase/phosphoenolpyruvate mutase family protein [Burkholderia ubonensis]|uniref:isocitrate lyase/phosphoenolpyruvate mutase family protein n=1 Tax=Burkholderia ubonensis TaxID=101571 RepID=UPI0009B57718
MRRQAGPLLLANVWDVASAHAAKAAGHAAVGTSSAAMADMLGHADGEGRKDRFRHRWLVSKLKHFRVFSPPCVRVERRTAIKSFGYPRMA